MIYYGRELYHHGIIGQRWGVRRTKDGIKLSRVSKHIINEKRKDRSQTPKDVIDSLINPIHIKPIKVYPDGKRSVECIGLKATTCTNPDDGTINTSHITGRKKLKHYKKGGK